mmetsp:Transcript_16184/g.38721  ORF Transcript_16184/g.38721 Transcript_16184/m.38721 type:complete len:300 (-) Transcript_16184:58-957(-)
MSASGAALGLRRLDNDIASVGLCGQRSVQDVLVDFSCQLSHLVFLRQGKQQTFLEGIPADRQHTHPGAQVDLCRLWGRRLSDYVLVVHSCRDRSPGGVVCVECTWRAGQWAGGRHHHHTRTILHAGRSIRHHRGGRRLVVRPIPHWGAGCSEFHFGVGVGLVTRQKAPAARLFRGPDVVALLGAHCSTGDAHSVHSEDRQATQGGHRMEQRMEGSQVESNGGRKAKWEGEGGVHSRCTAEREGRTDPTRRQRSAALQRRENDAKKERETMRWKAMRVGRTRDDGAATRRSVFLCKHAGR